MLSRFISISSHLNRLSTLISSKPNLVTPLPISQLPTLSNPTHYFAPRTPHFSLFSTNGKNGNDESATSTTDLWRMSSEVDQDIDSIFSVESENRDDNNDQYGDNIPDPFIEVNGKDHSYGQSDIIRGMKENPAVGVQSKSEDYRPWSFSEEKKERGEEDVFGIEEEEAAAELGGLHGIEVVVGGEKAQEKALVAVLKGPDRAFGDLTASSGITDEMLDSLIVLKNFDGIQGLTTLSEIEDMRFQRTTKKSSRAEMERQKQEAAAKGRVREVDEKGRAYGTGKRKCSIVRVWINPGEGKFIVNDKEFDVYFPMIDHRAALLRPFSETKTLGLWDVNCTVKGGGTSGQVGAIRLGISRALQNWEPGFRPPLKEAGFLTRDSRIVERKKPSKAKARKSFQWVKR